MQIKLHVIFSFALFVDLILYLSLSLFPVFFKYGHIGTKYILFVI